MSPPTKLSTERGRDGGRETKLLIMTFLNEWSDCNDYDGHCTIYSDETESIPVLELMLKQLFAVLIECVAQPVENLSRLGCSCIR